MELLSHVTEKQATKSGADALAVISGLFDAPDIAAQALRGTVRGRKSVRLEAA